MGNPRKTKPRFVWSKKALSLLGKSSDPSVARELGLPIYTVRWKRMVLGIAPAHSKREKLKWTARNFALLGKISDSELANRLGLARDTISTKRRSLGIPTVSTYRRFDWGAEMLKDIRALKTTVFAKKYNMSPSAVSQKRRQLELCQYPRGIIWPPTVLKLLGTASDLSIAKMLGISRKAVCEKRLQLGISSQVARKSID
jgi:hypothetical protein